MNNMSGGARPGGAWPGLARHGWARPGQARLGEARRGRARNDYSLEKCRKGGKIEFIQLAFRRK